MRAAALYGVFRDCFHPDAYFYPSRPLSLSFHSPDYATPLYHGNEITPTEVGSVNVYWTQPSRSQRVPWVASAHSSRLRCPQFDLIPRIKTPNIQSALAMALNSLVVNKT